MASSENTAEKQRLDMLNGTLWDKLPRFALPVAATAILGQLFNAADLAVVGNFAGNAKTAAVAAVGANAPVIGLIVNLFIGVSLGANVVIANAVGKKDNHAVQTAVHTAVTFAGIAGIIVAVLGEIVAAPFLNLLCVPQDVFPLALLYLRIYFLGMPVIMLYNFEAAVFRSVGETNIPLVVLAVSGVLNVILNLFFVAILKMTVDGVALATVISNAVSAVLLYRKLRTTQLGIRLEPKKLRIDRLVLARILKIGLPAGLQSALFSVSNLVIQSAINSLGTVVMAGSSAAFNIEIMTYNILNSFSQACTTFTGQNAGAGKSERCKRIPLLCIAEASIALGVAIAAILFFGKTLLAFFNNDPDVIESGYIRLMFILPAHCFSMLYEIMAGYLRGFGISLAPAILTMLGVCGIRIVWIHTAFVKSPSFTTIMTVYPISLCATAILLFLAVLWFHPGRSGE